MVTCVGLVELPRPSGARRFVRRMSCYWVEEITNCVSPGVAFVRNRLVLGFRQLESRKIVRNLVECSAYMNFAQVVGCRARDFQRAWRRFLRTK